MKLDRNITDTLYRNDFAAFVHAAFEAVNPGKRLMPNWHILAVCYAIELMVMGLATKRLVVNLCPRSLKSFIISVCLPTWLLGRDPTARIICASYSRDLAEKFSRDCRALMDTPFYKRVFPGARLNPDKTSAGEFESTRGGFRLATSVGGTLTGRGGDMNFPVNFPVTENLSARTAKQRQRQPTRLSLLSKIFGNFPAAAPRARYRAARPVRSSISAFAASEISICGLASQ